MEHASRRLAVVLTTVSALLTGCGSDQGPDADGGRDTGVEAGLDAGADAGPETIVDAAVDVGTDAEVDAATDAGSDAEWDAGAEVSVDAGPDEGPDAPVDAGSDGLADAGGDAVTDAGPPPVAFRFTDMDLRDPHGFMNLIGCRDVTDTPVGGFSINGELQTRLATDGDGDGLLDLSPTLVFRSFSQIAPTQPVEFQYARCTAPATSTTCRSSVTSIVSATATNMTASQCLTFIPGTVRPYVPAITSTSAPCFVTDARTVTVPLFGTTVSLRDARIAAQYVGAPAATLTNGLFIGFLSEADANSTLIPASYPVIGGQPLSSILPGGASNCASFSDKDVHGGVSGWWFYFNFVASRATWSDT